MSKGPQQPAHQGGFARAESPAQVNHAAGACARSERRAERFVAARVGQLKIERHGVRSLRAAHQGTGAASSASRPSASPTPICRAAEPRLLEWLAQGWHGEMEYMARHGALRARPAELMPGTLRVISCRMDYLSDVAEEHAETVNPDMPTSRATPAGRDYHKVLRDRLQKLGERIAAEAGPFGYRVFTDSAPVLEVELAARAGIGWRGKHTLLLDRDAGSWFFLGEIYCDLPLARRFAAGKITAAPASAASTSARRRRSAVPTSSMRAAASPTSRSSTRARSRRSCARSSATASTAATTASWSARGTGSPSRAPEEDFEPRNGLDRATLVELFAWTEDEFDERLQGSPIRRIGYERWLRNLAVGLGNAPTSWRRGRGAALHARTIPPRWSANTCAGRSARRHAFAPGSLTRCCRGSRRSSSSFPTTTTGAVAGDARAPARRRGAARRGALRAWLRRLFLPAPHGRALRAEGYAFYALDLRKHGRSLRPHQHPNFCKSVAEYYADITRAIDEIGEPVLLAGHSTGG